MRKLARKQTNYFITAIILLIINSALPVIACSPEPSFDKKLERVIAPYEFNLAVWEFKQLSVELKNVITGQSTGDGDSAAIFLRYFAYSRKIVELEALIDSLRSGQTTDNLAARSAELEAVKEQHRKLEKPAISILQLQITRTLNELGIESPFDLYFNTGFTFPPVYLKIADPPNLIIISPREKIEMIRTVMLEPFLTTEEKIQIEKEADGLGVVSLVEKLGGVATYPSFVSNRSDLEYAIETAAHEWVHQYLVFRPLGFRYLLSLEGIYRDPEIAALDETVASILGKEIGRRVYERYYWTDGGETPEQPVEPRFDFYAAMREIRQKVDGLLAAGRIEEAEAFMAERRDYLEKQGYYIRKLNQAYFAFHGNYTDNPGSVDPMGEQMRVLRNKSRDIKEFIDRVSFITSRSELQALLAPPPSESN